MDKRTKILIGSAIAVGVLSAIGIVLYLRNRKNKKNKEFIESDDWLNPSGIDVNTKGYKVLLKQINDTKEVLKGYEKDGLVLIDTETGNKGTDRSSKAVYWMRTKNFPSIKTGLQNDNSLNDKQRGLLLKIYDDYFNVYLPIYFDKSVYNPNAQWYKDLGGTIYDKYKL
jgi:hypothetical protein